MGSKQLNQTIEARPGTNNRPVTTTRNNRSNKKQLKQQRQRKQQKRKRTLKAKETTSRNSSLQSTKQLILLSTNPIRLPYPHFIFILSNSSTNLPSINPKETCQSSSIFPFEPNHHIIRRVPGHEDL